MGRRSRKRVTSPIPSGDRAPVPATPHQPPRQATWRAHMNEAPKAPWAPVPLTEISILIGMVLVTLGFLDAGDRRGILLVAGFTIVTLAAGELAVREHFAGFRSHSALLAAICGLIVAVPVYFLPVPQEVVLVVALAIGGAAFAQLRKAFIRRSGGMGFRA